MNPNKILLLGSFVIVITGTVLGQGFVNLGFESAVVPGGTQPGTYLPIASALPGWNGPSLVWYNGISLGGPGLSLIDSNAAQYGDTPLQGRYSAYLFGGYIPGQGMFDVSISQTGLVPTGTLSLRLDAYSWHGFTVSLGGHTLPLMELQTFPGSPRSYTRYGADIALFAGQVAELRITAPAPYGTSPNGLLLDNLVFSPSPIPEPNTLSIVGLGLFLLCRIIVGRVPLRH